LILEDDQVITMKYLPSGLTERKLQSSIGDGRQKAEPGLSNINQQHRYKLPSEGISLDVVEMSLVQQAMEYSNSNQTRAAELLGISRDQLRYRLKKLEEFNAKAAS
jgi:DNA-binding protein Fis